MNGLELFSADIDLTFDPDVAIGFHPKLNGVIFRPDTFASSIVELVKFLF